MNFQEALDFLYAQLPMYQRVGKAAINKNLSRTIQLCELLGNPQNSFKSIHIAGTNGKGSTAHALASVLMEAGYKTGLYTSPHLKSFRERIRVNGNEVSENFIIDFLGKYRQEIENIKPSFFEITVAMAFSYFDKESVDIAVIETGMGGRWDSTNVILPILSIITSIGMDHEEFLGNTLELIAFEKAGIIKKNVPVIVGEIDEAANTVIAIKASDMESTFIDSPGRWKVESDSNATFRLTSNNGISYDNVDLGIKGKYFLKNVPHILEATEQLKLVGLNISSTDVRQGLKKIKTNTGLKGRWQQLESDPVVICDVGHNEDGLRQIVEQLYLMSHHRLHMVYGTVGDKNLDKILPLLPSEAIYYFCAPNIPRALDVNELTKKANSFGLIGRPFNSVNDAISQAKQNASSDDVIFIGGSTFVVAEIENL